MLDAGEQLRDRFEDGFVCIDDEDASVAHGPRCLDFGGLLCGDA